MALDVASSNGTPLKSASKPLQKLPAEPNVLEVVFGSLLIKPWYPSFYPEELVGRKVERLYVCQWCFKYSKELMAFLGHLVRLQTPTTITPGEPNAYPENMSSPHHPSTRRENLHKRQLLALRN